MQTLTPNLSLQLSFFCLGVCTMLFTTATRAGDYKYEVLLSICCVMGLFDGCFVTLIGPIAFDLCGPAGAGQAIGSLLALFSLPMTVGPPVAGLIYDKIGSYYPAFIAAGVPPILGSLLMFLIRLVPDNSTNLREPDQGRDGAMHQSLIINLIWQRFSNVNVLKQFQRLYHKSAKRNRRHQTPSPRMKLSQHKPTF